MRVASHTVSAPGAQAFSADALSVDRIITAIQRGWRDRHLLLLLDFDGTLTGYTDDPREVRLAASRRALIASLARRPSVTIGIVSGRRLHEVREYFADDRRLYYAGLHGLEIEGPHLSFFHLEAARAVDALLSSAEAIETVVRMTPGAFLEDKGLSLAVHVRPVRDPRDRLAVMQRLREVAAPHLKANRLKLVVGSAVYELLPSVAWSKGDAAWVIKTALEMRRGRCWPVFIGDDATDEEAFEVIGADGVTVAVGDGPTRAAYRVKNPDEVERLLKCLAK